MKFKLFTLIVASALPGAWTVQGQTTAFTYQGRLSDQGAPANGSYNLRFTLYDASTGGNAVAGPVTRAGASVTDGLFAVTLDFGPDAFTGLDLWLGIAVRPDGDTGPFSELAPRQPLVSAPHAIRALTSGEADHATNADHATSADTASTATTAASAATVPWTGVGGMPAGFADGADNDTTYGAGAGLDLIGEIFNIQFAGSGTADTAARGDHDHAGTYAPLAHEHDASDLTGGTLANERLPAGVPFRDADQTWTGTNIFAGPVILTNSASVLAGGLIAPGSVPGAALAPGSITTPLLSNGAITGAKLANHSVTSAKVADGSLTPDDVDTPAFATTFWKADGNAGTTAGTHFLGTTDNQPLELQVNGLRALRLEPTDGSDIGSDPVGAPNVIVGAPNNLVEPGVVGATISGGGATNFHQAPAPNVVRGNYSTIGGGFDNRVGSLSVLATIGGGAYNEIEAGMSAPVIGGGGENLIQTRADSAVIGGGWSNTIQSNAYNAIIAGGTGNTVQSDGRYATIGGGSQNHLGAKAEAATIAGGKQNLVGDDAIFAFIGGGQSNTNQAGGNHSTIVGGFENVIETVGDSCTIAGGKHNTIGHQINDGTIAGGAGNRVGALSDAATIGGGEGNLIHSNGWFGTIPGGTGNEATNHAFAAGTAARALHTGAFVWSDVSDWDHPFTSTGSNQFLIRAAGGVGININDPAGAALNVAGTVRATEFRGSGAHLSGLSASQLSSGVVPDGRLSANVSLLGGSIESAEIADGTVSAADVQANIFWQSTGNAGTTAGTHFLGTTDSQPVEFKVNNLRALRLEPTGDSAYDSDSNPDGAPNVIAGAPSNLVEPGVVGATISGGGGTDSFGVDKKNTVLADYGTIGGGMDNTISPAAHVAGIGSGEGNSVGEHSRWATIGGGVGNEIGSDAPAATIGGGRQNVVPLGGEFATVPGGIGNTASRLAFAAGNRAKANHTGAFVWADSTEADFASTGNNQFLVRASGGVGVNKNNPATALDVNGTVTADSFAGDASGLTGLDAANLSSGTLPNARLSSDVARRSGGNTFTGDQVVSSGTVGINTSSPQADLHVKGDVLFEKNDGRLVLGTPSRNDPGRYGIQFTNNWLGLFVGDDTQKQIFGFYSDFSSQRSHDAHLRVFGHASGNWGKFTEITHDGVNGIISTDSGHLLLAPNQNVGIGLAPASSPAFKLHVNGSAGKPGGGSWSVASDVRLKKNIQPLQGALDKLLQLHGVTFEYKDPEAINELPGQRMGLIAQEVEKVFPDWVEEGPDGMKRLTVRGFEALTIEALRQVREEKDARIARLEEENAAVRHELAELKQLVQQLIK